VIKVVLRFFAWNDIAVHSFARPGIELQPSEAEKSESPRVLRRYRINAQPKQRLWSVLIKPGDLRIGVRNVG
jgi:hypothetical protein